MCELKHWDWNFIFVYKIQSKKFPLDSNKYKKKTDYYRKLHFSIKLFQVGTGHLTNQNPSGEDINEAVGQLYNRNGKDSDQILHPPDARPSILRNCNSTRSSTRSLRNTMLKKEDIEGHDDSRKDSLISLISGSRSKFSVFKSNQ